MTNLRIHCSLHFTAESSDPNALWEHGDFMQVNQALPPNSVTALSLVNWNPRQDEEIELLLASFNKSETLSITSNQDYW